MELSGFIEENLAVLSERWLEEITSTYHKDAVGFIKDKDDAIHNPLGHAIKEMVDTVLSCLIKGCDEQTLDSAMYRVIQMRAVQDFTPSDAVSFIVQLRTLIAGLAREKQAGHEVVLEMDEISFGLMSRAFNMYSKCRETIGDIKVEELKRNLYMMLRKSDMVEVNAEGSKDSS